MSLLDLGRYHSLEPDTALLDLGTYHSFESFQVMLQTLAV